MPRAASRKTMSSRSSPLGEVPGGEQVEPVTFSLVDSCGTEKAAASSVSVAAAHLCLIVERCDEAEERALDARRIRPAPEYPDPR